MISQVRTGVELRLEDRQVAGEQVHQQAGLGAAVHQRAEREGDHPRVGGLLGLVVLLQRLAGVEVDAAAEHPPEVLVAPHHALREAGGAAGVDDVQVVGAALARSRARRSGPPARRRSSTPPNAETSDWSSGSITSGIDDDGLQLLVLGRAGGHQRRVGALVDQRHHVGVVEEVVELALDVAVVHVDVDRADLDDREHRDDVLDAVLGVDRRRGPPGPTPWDCR